MARTRDFAEVIKKKLSTNKQLADSISEHAFHASVAEQIYNVRVEAGLTQDALGKLIGSTQSVIARLEDSDYDGHSLSILLRICKALGKELHVAIRERLYTNAEGHAISQTTFAVSRFHRVAAMIREETKQVRINQPEMVSPTTYQESLAA